MNKFVKFYIKVHILGNIPIISEYDKFRIFYFYISRYRGPSSSMRQFCTFLAVAYADNDQKLGTGNPITSEIWRKHAFPCLKSKRSILRTKEPKDFATKVKSIRNHFFNKWNKQFSFRCGTTYPLQIFLSHCVNAKQKCCDYRLFI